MAIRVARGKSDKVLKAIIAKLKRFQADYPREKIDLYRQNSVSVRVRIVDPEFARQGKAQRNELVWGYLEKLSEDVQGDISTLLLLTPDEMKSSFANLEFDDPTPSKL